MATQFIMKAGRTGARYQRGIATLMVTLVILIILTIIIMSSSSVAFFEQRTATNEFRARLAEQAAEYALNLGGEYLKVNVGKLSTNVSPGWLNSSSRRWQSCAGITAAGHPCVTERNITRRAQLYYFTSDGATHTTASTSDLAAMDLFNSNKANANALAAGLSSVGGTASFPATAQVFALLCRLDSSSTLAQDDRCRLSPAQGRRIAVTLIATSTLTGENSSATVRETWGTLTSNSFGSSTPLVTAGAVGLVGTFTIVDAPNAGGYGIPAAAWSAQDIAGGGSWQTCPMEDYLGSFPLSQLTTAPGCAATTPSTCNCDSELISVGGSADGLDILDKDSNGGANPDITFFPGSSNFSTQALRDSTRMDYRAVSGACLPTQPYCMTDDNLFEWIFHVDVTAGDTTVVQTNCVVPASFNPTNANPGDCEVKALSDLNFKPIANCSGLNANSAGLYYVTGNCDLRTADNIIGDPSHPIILVVDNDITFGQTDNYFGMVFVRSKTNAATVSGNSNGKFFGSIVVEGGASHLNGTMDLIYMDTTAGNPNDPLPDTTRFARLPNSWLDNATGF